MVTMDNGSEKYGAQRTFISLGRKNLKCGKIGKVKYSRECIMIMKFVKFEGECRLRDVVRSLEKYENVVLDMARIKEMLKDHIIERQELLEDGTLKVVDWVVA